MEDIYSADPEFSKTPLVSPVPPPSMSRQEIDHLLSSGRGGVGAARRRNPDSSRRGERDPGGSRRYASDRGEGYGRDRELPPQGQRHGNDRSSWRSGGGGGGGGVYPDGRPDHCHRVSKSSGSRDDGIRRDQYRRRDESGDAHRSSQGPREREDHHTSQNNMYAVLDADCPPPRSAPSNSRGDVSSVNRRSLMERRAKEVHARVEDVFPYVRWLENGSTVRQFTPEARVEPEDDAILDAEMFSDAELVQKVMDAKSKLASFTGEQINRARAAANPYERVGKSVFINRAAVKLGELDAACDIVGSMLRVRDASVFADVCAGPGGFSEYLLWRTQERGTPQIRGVGFTLRCGGDDNTLFAPDQFVPTANAVERFQVCYGVPICSTSNDTATAEEDLNAGPPPFALNVEGEDFGGDDDDGDGDATIDLGDGDIFKLENLRELSKVVDSKSHGAGAALVTSDGGISVAGQEGKQEQLTRHLKLCEVLAMFHLLARGGTFVLKVYDLLTPFMAGITYLLYAHFEKVTIVKPHSSRPANSERYVVCIGLLERRPKAVLLHLEAVHAQLVEHQNVTEVVSLLDLLRDNAFREYLREINIRHADQQLYALDLVVHCAKHPGKTNAQSDLISKCLQAWDLPSPPQPRHARHSRSPMASSWGRN